MLLGRYFNFLDEIVYLIKFLVVKEKKEGRFEF